MEENLVAAMKAVFEPPAPNFAKTLLSSSRPAVGTCRLGSRSQGASMSQRRFLIRGLDSALRSARLQPPLREAFRLPFLRWCSSGMAPGPAGKAAFVAELSQSPRSREVQAFCWLLLVRLAFQKDTA